ncbi:phosphotransferase [Occultella gossypii]|uniref:Phosphotransferase n=1 Tax=Occultella gossypii TaxID=2800820 RepID=A0ABS7S992_9MICO|nr:phosphotransferase [Occultella gossypii]MBZ2196907.1 phosphotransferase [Occultella gossypii]
MTADMTGPPGELIGRGRTADVFALGDGSVLRRYRDGQSVEREGELLGYLARQGFPVPLVHKVSGGDLVMERLHGPTMLGALTAGRTDLESAMAVLADLHHALRRVRPPSEARQVAQAPGAPQAPTWHGLIHLDLHPDNVILEPGRGPMLIDWNNAEIGPGDLDVAMTALIMAEVAVNPERADAVGALHDDLPHAVEQFLAAAGGDPAAHLDEAARRRRANPTLSAAELRAVVRAGGLVAELLR